MARSVYSIRVESPFILTQKEVKRLLGIGHKVISVETERDIQIAPITDVDSAALQIVTTGYRALARAHHPDLGGDPETMKTLNQCKRELLDLLKQIKDM